MLPDPLAPPPPPPARRLNRAVWMVAALVVLVTLCAVLFVGGPRGRRPATPAARPLAGGAPEFLEHPPAPLPAAPATPAMPPRSAAEEAYLEGLLRRQLAAPTGAGGAGGMAGEAPPLLPQEPAASDAQAAADEPWGGGRGPGRAAGGAAGSGAAAGAGAGTVRDSRREAFLRALQAPLSRMAPVAPAAPVATAAGEGSAAARQARLGSDLLAGLAWPATAAGSGQAGALPQGVGEVGERGRPGLAWSAGERPGAGGLAAGERLAAAGLAGAGGGALAAVPGGSLVGSGSERFAGAGGGAAGDRFAAFTAGAARLPGVDLPTRFHPAPDPWTVSAGTLIQALLLNEVNSDLPGNLLAQVSRNVYDFRQRVVLLPQGTRLLGRYDNQVAVGQRRLLVAWTRLVLPDGASYELPGLPGTSAAGAAGLPARVNNHVLRVFGDAVLLSLLSAGAELSQPQRTGFAVAPGTGAVAAAALGQELSSVGLELLRRNIAIQPTLHLPAATALTVFVNGDLHLGGRPEATAEGGGDEP
jgi:hypothetical protein